MTASGSEEWHSDGSLGHMAWQGAGDGLCCAGYVCVRRISAGEGHGRGIRYCTRGGTSCAVHIFRDNGTFTPTETINDANVLIVGGGGGGGTVKVSDPSVHE